MHSSEGRGSVDNTQDFPLNKERLGLMTPHSCVMIVFEQGAPAPWDRCQGVLQLILWGGGRAPDPLQLHTIALLD